MRPKRGLSPYVRNITAASLRKRQYHQTATLSHTLSKYTARAPGAEIVESSSHLAAKRGVSNGRPAVLASAREVIAAPGISSEAISVSPRMSDPRRNASAASK
jgi:hypothetical protein